MGKRIKKPNVTVYDSAKSNHINTSNALNLDNKPIVSLTYISKMNNGCLVSIFNRYDKEKKTLKNEFIKFQNFITGFSSCNNISNAIKRYTGTTSKISARKNTYVENLLKKLTKKYPELSGVVDDELIHVHPETHGDGKAVYFGFAYSNIFHIVYFDPEHEFSKRK